MADPKKVERGKTYLQAVLAKVPEDKRAAVAALLDVEDAVELVGDGLLMKADHSRAMAEAQQEAEKAKGWHGELNKWWVEKQDEITKLKVENEKLKLGGGTGGGAGAGGGGGEGGGAPIQTQAVDLSGYVKKEDVATEINKRVAQAEASVVPLVSVLSTITLKHFKDFDEVLDVNALIEHCNKTQTPIDKGGYESFAKEKIEAKALKAREAEIAAAEKRGEEKGRQAAAATPYPMATSEPTTLSGLDKSKQAEYGVAAAVNEFNKMVGQRAAG